MSRSAHSQLPESVERELAALADGSLRGAQREQALARVQASPELRAALAEQERALAAIRSIETSAPAALHERIAAMASGEPSVAGVAAGAGSLPFASLRRRLAPTGARRPRFGWTLAGATALAALTAVLLAVALPGGGGSASLTPQATAALTLSAATLPAPGESTRNRSELTASVGGVAFPYWKERFGWRGSGARHDTLGGRAITTVFYSNSSGQRVGYAIVAGPAPASAGSGGAGGASIRRWGVSYRLSSQDGANVIVWRRGGHLCVMAGRGVSPRTLLSLASWGNRTARAA